MLSFAAAAISILENGTATALSRGDREIGRRSRDGPSFPTMMRNKKSRPHEEDGSIVFLFPPETRVVTQARHGAGSWGK
jgi:hypothetical protein